MLELLTPFLFIGTLAFGGGQAALPLVERLAVADTGWLTPAQFAAGVGLSYATPGAVLILAAFIGYHAAVAVFTVPSRNSACCQAQRGALVPSFRAVCRGRSDRAVGCYPARAGTPV